MKHDLKCELWSYHAVASGDKTFEIRYNDRGFQKGDTVVLHPYESSYYVTQFPDLTLEISFVTGFQQRDGWVVFGFKSVSANTDLTGSKQPEKGMP